MYSNKILNFQESTTILNACTKKVWKPIEGPSYTDHIEVIRVRCRETMYLIFVFQKGQYESKYGSQSDSMKKAEK